MSDALAPSDFPHRCPACGSPAYIGFSSVSCLGISCPNVDADFKREQAEAQAMLDAWSADVQDLPAWINTHAGRKLQRIYTPAAFKAKYGYLPPPPPAGQGFVTAPTTPPMCPGACSHCGQPAALPAVAP